MHRLRWTIVVPVKTLIRAKTRLAAAAGPYRTDLAVAVASVIRSMSLGPALLTAGENPWRADWLHRGAITLQILHAEEADRKGRRSGAGDGN